MPPIEIAKGPGSNRAAQKPPEPAVAGYGQ